MTSELSASEPSNLQLAYQRLLALERFKSGFLARTSHEMRSPINTIVSLHQLILEDLCEGPEEEKEFITQSKDAALKMLALFDRVTAVSKLDVGREPAKLEKVDLSFLLPEVEMLTSLQAANQNVRYTVESPTDECEIVTDEKWLKNILTSLIQDAIPHTKALTVTVEKSGDTIAVIIDCDGEASQKEDRTAAGLQSQLKAVSDMSELSDKETDPRSLAANDIELSTGLIVAMAHTALPLINGSLTMASASETPERTQLKCTFPVVSVR
ncbi:MAG: HAMP domain-containing sensor histidine kinase [Cyanobacteria bacterium J06643_4]